MRDFGSEVKFYTITATMVNATTIFKTDGSKNVISLSFLIKIVSTGRRYRRLSTKPVAGIVMLFTSAKLKEDYMTERLIEHFKALTQIGHASAVAEHSISTGHNIKWDHFEILASGQCDLQCKIKETLLIRDLKPALNENVGSENLLLY